MSIEKREPLGLQILWFPLANQLLELPRNQGGAE
jgi:hypothetical protein